MIKLGTLTTAIRIQKFNESTIQDSQGFDTSNDASNWVDIIDEDILCNWKNKYGIELQKGDTTTAKEPAKLLLWYILGIDSTHRVLRVEDAAIFEITNVDDIGNRHQQLEIEVKRYEKG